MKQSSTVLRLLARHSPIFLVVLLCGAATSGGTAWILTATALTLAACLIYIFRVSALELLVVTIPVTFYTEVGVLTVNVTLSDFFFAIVAVQLFGNQEVRSIASRYTASLKIAVAATSSLIVICLGTIWTRSVLGLATDWIGFFSNTLKLIFVIALFAVALVSSAGLKKETMHRLLTMWSTTAAVVGAVGATGSILYPLGIDIGMSYDFRATATFEDPNAFASYLLLSIPICLLARHLSGRHLFCWQLVPLLAGVYTSYSRGAFVALVIMAVGLLILSLGDPKLLSLRIFSVAMAAAAVWLLFSGALESLFEDTRGAGFGSDGRFVLWSAAWELWKSSPIFGIGMGQFVNGAAAFIDHGAEGVIAHNTYLSMLAETGLAGFALFMLIPVRAAGVLCRDMGTGSRLLLGSLLSVMTMAASLNLQNSRSLWVLLAISFASVEIKRNDDSSEPQLTHGASRNVATKWPLHIKHKLSDIGLVEDSSQWNQHSES